MVCHFIEGTGVPFYRRDLSALGFWCLGESWKQPLRMLRDDWKAVLGTVSPFYVNWKHFL